MSGALEGITVLDLSQGAAGPTCAMSLGDLGAVVLKVEPPGGEWGRGLGPPFVNGIAAAFLGMNRNKRSIVIDLKKPGGADVVLRLAARCDVALESFRPGVADRLGIGYEAMCAVNPRLIYASISAFGQHGPWRDRPGVDGVAQAMGGIMSVTGSADGPPVKVGVPAADMAAGVYASQTILAALFARERTGQGQRVDVSLLDSLLAYQVVPLSMYLASGQPPQRLGSAAPYAAPNEVYPTQDGHVMVAAYAPKRWRALCDVVGRPELATDQRFDTNEKRVSARSALSEVLEPLSLKAGEPLFTEGDPGATLFFIREGTIDVLLRLAGNKRHHVAAFGRGDYVGEMSFLDKGKRSADAEARTDAELYALPRERFNEIALERPVVATMVFARLALLVSRRLRVANREVSALEER
jgi:crotonobetainyl-CoA:carnitine CoA-transferase CaiB-like acyl-CoA transferase